MRWMESLSNMLIVLLCETEIIWGGTEKKYLERGHTFNNQAFLNGKNNLTIGSNTTLTPSGSHLVGMF